MQDTNEHMSLSLLMMSQNKNTDILLWFLHTTVVGRIAQALQSWLSMFAGDLGLVVELRSLKDWECEMLVPVLSKFKS